MTTTRLALLAFLVVLATSGSLFTKYLLPRTSPGLCLDGTPAAHYVAPGDGVNKTKFLLYFEGGLACAGADLSQSLENCYKKSQTDEGSSTGLEPEFDGVRAGIMSGDSRINPTFYDWTRVIFEYCDGSIYQGYRNLPIAYKGVNLFFRGHNITEQRLLALNLSAATEVVLAGSEDGGIAAMQWANHVKTMTKATIRVIADSGILLDVPNPTTKVNVYRQNYINLLKLANEIDPPAAECVAKFPTEKWRCFFVENLYSSLTVPLYVVDTLYDEESFSYTLGVDCVDSFGSLASCNTTERAAIEGYKTGVFNLLGKIAQGANGAWAPACVNFEVIGRKTWYDGNYRVPAGSPYLCNYSVGRWMAGVAESHKHVDTVSWPDNAACSGKHMLLDI